MTNLKGFDIYALKKKEHMNVHVGSSTFSNTREVTSRIKLTPGTYIIIPSTKCPGSEGQFLLRVFYKKKEARNMTEIKRRDLFIQEKAKEKTESSKSEKMNNRHRWCMCQ